MTYYEEFGISSSATVEDIRHAHRRMVKFLHPDLQSDDSARQLAEIQTRRINGIAKLLLDSEQRQEYDRSLLPQSPLAAGAGESRVISKLYPSLSFVAAALLFLCGAIWMLQSDRATAVSATPLPAASSSVSKAPVPTAAPKTERAGLPFSNAARNISTKTPITRRESTKTVVEAEAMEPLPVTAAPPPEVALGPAPKPPTPATPSPPENPLVGTWIYVPTTAAAADATVYRPEYIEMRIRNSRGLLEGNYRARYHVPDRPLSPNVGFHFAGQAGTATAAYRWSGPNGLGGRVELKLVTANSIQVNWRVTEFTEAADLVSGTAILTRVQ